MKKISYKIIKEKIGNWRFYRVVRNDGELIKEFDDYNFQKPFAQAKKLLIELSKTV